MQILQKYHPKVIIKENMEDYSRFLRVYANVPNGLRRGIVSIVDGKTYSWDMAYFEITNNTELGKKIYKNLIDMEII